MRLSPHFTLTELAQTNHRSLAAENLAEAGKHIAPLQALCADLLEPLRAHFGAPVIIHSGYRSRSLNHAIGGSITSQHCLGEAADLHVHGVELRQVFDWVRLESGLAYGQILLEGAIPGQPGWVHLSLGEPWRPRDRSRQAMTWDAVNGYRQVPLPAAVP